MNTPSPLPIVRNADADRFEVEVEGQLCVCDYQLVGDRLRMTHVGVPSAVGGRGIAGELTRAALDWARSEGLSIVPMCPYVSAWIRRHPDYADLVAK